MKQRRPVVVIGMDAMERWLVEQMIQEGRMPNLARLRERGTYGVVKSLPDAFLSMVWPTFFSGQSLGSHGWYFNKLWNPREQRINFVDPSWLPIQPFWADLDARFRVALLDIPFATPPAPELNGLFLTGWQVHDDFGNFSVPSGLHGKLRRRFGRPAMTPEIFGPQDVRSLKQQHTEAVASLDQFAKVAVHLMGSESYDLVLAVVGGAHRGTHYLWSLDECDTSGASGEDLACLAGARDEIYEVADRTLGTIVDAAGPDARVMVMALHGMDRNHGWAERFPEIVAHLHAGGARPASKGGAIFRLKKALPWRWARQVTRRLPSALNRALVPLWSRNMLDWSSTRYFALPADLNGYLRINLRGRDAQGIVSAGAELDGLMEELTEDLLGLTDLRDGRPVVSEVLRVDELVGAEAVRRDMLPDLIVRWADTYVRQSPGVRSRFGELRWGAGRSVPSGRSGNHTPAGWFVAAGPGVRSGSRAAPVNSLDLVPTLLDWMGAPIPSRMEGEPLRDLTSVEGRESVSS